MQPTIGLEIHAELKTKRKMFCFCENNPDDSEPNTHICPVCMAHPGALPIPNKEAIKFMLKIALALNGKISDEFSEFDRKSYFYPDIPKAYQISQYKYPFVYDAELLGVKIQRVHLEEDTARSLHEGSKWTKIDFNRAGVPLMELVTEPLIESAEQARAFAKELQLTLRRIGVSDANMEKGQMRVEANVSIKNPDGSFGTKVEVKNLNSFKSVYNAIEYEIKRQTEILKNGRQVVQETRGWDEVKGETFSQRVKEEAADYRYFPDPDLPKISIGRYEDFDLNAIKNELPELPSSIRNRLKNNGLSDQLADFFASNFEFTDLLDEAVSVLGELSIKKISTDLSGALGTKTLTGEIKSGFIEIMKFLLSDRISSRVAKDLIVELVSNPNIDVESYIRDNNLEQQFDFELVRSVLQEVINKNPNAVEDYKSGKEKALGAIIGQTMRALKEQGISVNPQKLNELAKDLINN